MSGEGTHFIGIGGIGMSGLAKVSRARGLPISGCDMQRGISQRALKRQGVAVSTGHNPNHLTDEVGQVVYSTAISPREPELMEAGARGIRTISRGAYLAELASSSRLIATAGTHGKTTTAGMAAELLMEAGWDPTVLIGGHSFSLGGNARAGSGRYMVVESDESDGSFMLLEPEVAIVTNIDHEHLNHYRTFSNLVAAFKQFVSRVPSHGLVIRCQDDPIAREHLRHRHVLSYGLSSQADVRATQITPCGWGTEFRAAFQGQRLGTFRLRVPGHHNVVNALGIISLGLALDLSLMVVREALWAFRGTSRRFQLVELPRDVWFVDDYAHHPTEIEATLAADPSLGRHRLVVFQPHRFSRTKMLEGDFARCFQRADGLIVTDIYSAFESPIPNVSGERLAGLIKSTGHPCVRYVPRGELVGFLSYFVQPHDTVYFLGAGDIGAMCHDVASRLRAA